MRDEIPPDLPLVLLVFRALARSPLPLKPSVVSLRPSGSSMSMKLDARGAGARRVSGDGYFVSRLDHIPAEAGLRQLVRIAQLRAPAHEVALIVGHIKQNAAVRIGPDPFRHGSLEGHPFVRFIRHAGPVVRVQRGT